MDPYEKDDMPMLSKKDHEGSQLQRQILSTQSASWSLPMESLQSRESSNIVGFTGPLRSPKQPSFIEMTQRSGPLYRRTTSQDCPGQGSLGRNMIESPKENLPTYSGRDNYGERNDHLLKSGQLGMCSDPYCTICPSDYRYKAAQHKRNDKFDFKFDSSLYGDSKGWARRFWSFLYSCLPGIMNPHAKVVHQWNQFFVISCLVSIFIDPIFFFVLSVPEDEMCIVMHRPMAIIITVFRSITDCIYLLHMILQFRLAYVAPESRVVGAGDLVDHPKKIAIHYLRGFFFLDLFAVLPLPQIIVLFVLPKHLISSGANYAKNLLRAAVLIQYIPRLYRFLPLLAGESSIGFIFESAWANFVINLLTFVLVGHIVGSFWYLFGLQRVNQCLRDACDHMKKLDNHTKICNFMDCGYGDVKFNHSYPEWRNWYTNATTYCLIDESNFSSGFNYGIYQNAVFLTKQEPTRRYIYSLFWGFQQISTFAGNQVPSYFKWEVFFTMAIIGLGLLLFALLIGNMQNFLQSLGRRKLEMSLRQRDVEQWMSHRRLPDELRRRVREAEQYNWAATRGVNEETMMENLAEDLQREIRQHLFRFLDKVRIFAMMEEPILDSIRERLRQKTYIRGSTILYPGGLIEKMVFIVRGTMESTGEDGAVNILAENNICGEELLIWYLDNSATRDVKRTRNDGERPYSTKSVTCLTNVEAFILQAEDLGEVTRRFSRFLKILRVQRAIRYETPYWRRFAATCIQVAWRYRKKRLNRAKTGSQSSTG